MKRFFIGLFMLGFVITVSTNVFAQTEEKKGTETEGKRVIEEKILLKDPTVAEPKKWLIGGSLEYWYITGPYNTYNSANQKVTEGNIKGDMPGGNIAIGYDKFTLQYSYREGKFGIDSTYLGSGVKTHEEQNQTEHEATLRYLFSSDKPINPYVLIGYNQITLERTTDIITSGWTWSYNDKTRRKTETVFNSGLIGIGAIVPLTKDKNIGIRGDARFLFTDAEYTRDDGYKVTGSGAGVGGTLTAYWNIFKGLNLQAGGKGQLLNGGNAGAYSKAGAFASLGYAFRF